MGLMDIGNQRIANIDVTNALWGVNNEDERRTELLLVEMRKQTALLGEIAAGLKVVATATDYLARAEAKKEGDK